MFFVLPLPVDAFKYFLQPIQLPVPVLLNNLCFTVTGTSGDQIVASLPGTGNCSFIHHTETYRYRIHEFFLIQKLNP